jgi:hypothetical protein
MIDSIGIIISSVSQRNIFNPFLLNQNTDNLRLFKAMKILNRSPQKVIYNLFDDCLGADKVSRNLKSDR